MGDKIRAATKQKKAKLSKESQKPKEKIRHTKPDFVNLHAHSGEGSLLDAHGSCSDLAHHAAKIGYKSLGITEHGNLFSAVPFTKACREAGIKPIIGMESYWYHGDRTYRPGKGEKMEDRATHMVLLAKNETGWRNLCKLSSESYLSGFYYKPRIDLDILKEHSEGIIALSACLNGVLNRFALNDKMPIAIKQAETMLEIFGKDNFFLEVQPHPFAEQEKANALMKWFRKRYGFRYALTLDSHYVRKRDSDAHDALLCISTGQRVKDTERMKYLEEQYYLRSPKQVRALAMRKEFFRCMHNTMEIAERCDFELELGKMKFPKFDVPEGCLSPHSFMEAELELGLSALARKIGLDCDQFYAYQRRMQYESKVIEETGFVDYFLVVSDFVKWAKRKKLSIGPSRGSVAGSLVAYVLEITDVDPIKYDLSFERFLNKHRVSIPDIDLDFSHEDHGKVVDYITEKYTHVAHIMTVSKMQARSAIKDVGRVLDIPYGVTDKISKLIPQSGKVEIDLEKAVEMVPALQVEQKKNPYLFRIAKELEGTPRHTSLHAAGYVIAPGPITDYIPTFTASTGAKKKKEKVVATQGDMDHVADLGLVKMDLLRITSLDVEKEAIDSIKRTHDIDIDISNIPLDDDKVYELLRQGKTEAIFQLGSSVMKHLLKGIKPTCLEDIVLANALVRPGAEIGASRIIQCRNGEATPRYIFKELKPVLEVTQGEFVYQEQLIKCGMVIAGFSFSEADVLRKACGKKDMKLMEQQREKFVSRSVKRGHERDKVNRLFDVLSAYAAYAFNRAHSVGYAILAYRTAWLKANYPAHFWAAAFTKEGNDKDTLARYVQAAKQMGIQVFPLDINKSQPNFVYENGGVRFGFRAVSTVGEATYPIFKAVQQGFNEKKAYGYYFVTREKKRAKK